MPLPDIRWGEHMRSRGRSIRLRIYFLVAIPLITMLGLFGYVAYTSVTSWENLDRGPNLIKATSEPLTNFVTVLQAERRAAVVYLARPDAASLTAYQATIANTRKAATQLSLALNSAGTKSSTTTAETTAIASMTRQISNMNPLRTEVTTRKLAPLDAFAAYTGVIAGQGAVLGAEAASISDAGPVLQGLGLIAAVNTQEDVSEQDAVLASALASGSLTGPDRVAFSQAAGRQQSDTLTYKDLLTRAELTTYQANFSTLAPTAVQTRLSTVQDAVSAGAPLSELTQQGLTPADWQAMTAAWLKARSSAGIVTAAAVLDANQQPAIDAKRRVWITAAVGAAGLILTLIVSLLLSRSINSRLTTLRRSALTLAREQLPAVVARLRRGEQVDVGAEAPPLRVGSDEIGQVGQAIDAVRQTAIRSAIDEAGVRRGVNDMFRNLARRNQSLLQRQLAVLDQMERRATDPDMLDDLFKIDHLTTRMRRHAEGLIILSGAPPGRAWSGPVKLVDVMRGAVAEVEDYARVTVATPSRGALAGSAVTDVIHLLAELIENATTFSPPYTQVRVGGEAVANGFAIEIEDRGLGMNPQRVREFNERLANPPDINPANTEQLGLFVVGQLARRHGVSVMLRPSPYGGITAVVLIPVALLMTDGPTAITTGSYVVNMRSGPQPAAAPDRNLGPDRNTGEVRLPGTPARGSHWPAAGAESANPGPASPVPAATSADPVLAANLGPVNPGPAANGPPYPPPAAPVAPAYQPEDPGWTEPALPRRTSGVARTAPGADPFSPPGTVPGAPGPGFDVFSPIHRDSPGPETAAPDRGPVRGGAPNGFGAGPVAGPGGGPGDDTALPRRIRQASLAPQLRTTAAASRPGAPGPAGVPQAASASLADMRSTLSAMQRGWQQGRSAVQHGAVPPNTVPPNTVPPNTVPPNTVPPGATPPNAVQPNTLQPNTVQPNTVQPNTVPLSTLLPRAAPPGAVPPNTVPPNTVPPNTVPPGAVPQEAWGPQEPRGPQETGDKG